MTIFPVTIGMVRKRIGRKFVFFAKRTKNHTGYHAISLVTFSNKSTHAHRTRLESFRLSTRSECAQTNSCHRQKCNGDAPVICFFTPRSRLFLSHAVDAAGLQQIGYQGILIYFEQKWPVGSTTLGFDFIFCSKVLKFYFDFDLNRTMFQNLD